MYYIYQTINLIDNKIYIGVHLSSDIQNDTYLGSGFYLRRAVKKYGRHNFKRIVLHQIESKQQAYLTERSIVNEQFIARPDTYNMKAGGKGGFPKDIDRSKIYTAQRNRKISESKKGRVFSDQHRQKLSQSLKGRKVWNKGVAMTDKAKHKLAVALTGKFVGENNPFYGKQHTEQAKKKISEARKTRKTVCGKSAH